MSFCSVKVSAVIAAPADRIYAVISDYRDGHPRILPRCFSALEIEAGGRGAGTRLRFKVRLLGTTTKFHMAVTEPTPGRVLKETDLRTGVVTLFILEPLEGGGRTRVTIDTDFKPLGFYGVIPYLLSVFAQKRIYRQELALLAAVVEQRPVGATPAASRTMPIAAPEESPMPTGHVFHPGHDEWHGQTVVVFTSGKRTVAGRWDAIAGGRLTMHDAAVHEEGAGDESRDAWLARLKQYGIPVQHRDFALPSIEVARVVRLRDA